MSEEKKYKNGEIQKNGLMYEDIYDFNKDGKVSILEDMEREEDIKRAEQHWEERRQFKEEQKQYVERPQASGASSSGCLGSFLVVFFCIGGIVACVMSESDGANILYIFGGLGLALASAWLCGLFGESPLSSDKKEMNVAETTEVKTKQKLELTDKKKLIKTISIVSAIIIAVVLLCNIGNFKNAHYYNQSVKMIEAGDYYAAQDELFKISDSDYKEKSELDDLCSALIAYDKGNKVHGPGGSGHYSFYTVHFSDEIEKKIKGINNQIDTQWDYDNKTEDDYSWYSSTTKSYETTTEATTRRYYSSKSKSKSKSKRSKG